MPDKVFGFTTTLQERLERKEAAFVALEAENERLQAEIGQWVRAYAPDIVAYPSREDIRAVNETPEFIIGRNAMMQVIHEGLKAILDRKEARCPSSSAKAFAHGRGACTLTSCGI